jgi:hypothetical protein
VGLQVAVVVRKKISEETVAESLKKFVDFLML